MALVRARISDFDRRHIIGRSGGCCNRCKTAVFKDNEFDEKARLGDDAHIWAYSKEGPRGSEPGAPPNPNDRHNIILLCKNCHALVDQQPKEFPPSILTKMRDEHYEWIDCCLGQTQVQKPNFNYVLYLNVPRLDMYAVANAMPLPQVGFGSAKCFDELRFEAGRVMASYTHILNDERMYAHQVGKESDISRLEIGQYFFIDPMNFRTVSKNKGADVQAAWASNKSIIYREISDWTLTLLINPIWITTSTASVEFRSGWSWVCGLARIHRIDKDAHKAIASPLFLAQP